MDKQSKLKMLIVTRNFPPLLGGMEKLVYNIYLELNKQFQLAVVGPEGCQDYILPDTALRTFPVRPLANFFAFCHWQAYKMSRDFDFDLVFAGSGVTASASVLAGLSRSKPIICYLHGLDLVEKNPVYRMVCIPAIKACDAVLVNSRNTARLARNAGITESRIRILHPGVLLPNPEKSRTDEFRRRFKIGPRPILLSVGRLTKRKGVVEFIEHSMPDIVRSDPRILLLIIGNEAKDALNRSSGMLDRIRREAYRRGVAANIKLLDQVDDETLSRAYSASQLLIFPVIEQPNDVEGFGMVALEAAAHGLPTIAFAVGGVIDAVKEGVSGHLISPGNYEGFTAAVLNHLDQKRVSQTSCIDFARSFAWEEFGRRLRAICLTTLMRHEN